MWRDFFYFNKRDRRAIIFFAVIAVGLAAVSVVRGLMGDGADGGGSGGGGKASLTGAGNGDAAAVGIRAFDPNTVDSATLVSYGLKPWKAKNLVRYRRAGGVFRTPESVMKLYGWDERDFETLLPYVVIGEEYKRKDYGGTYGKKGGAYGGNGGSNYDGRGRTPYERRQYGWTDGLWRGERAGRDYRQAGYTTYAKLERGMTVDPNTADTTLLMRVPGVGRKISSAIVKYRERLGGFTSERQLEEVRIFPPELLGWFRIDSSTPVRTIDVNAANFQTLNAHPYISYDQTKSLLTYRRVYGRLDGIASLRRAGIFSADELERLEPYLEFGEAVGAAPAADSGNASDSLAFHSH